VTQVLEAVRLIDLYHIPRETRERALERGRRCHVAIHYLVEGTLVETSVDPIDAGYVNAARAFLADSRLTPLLHEHRVAHPVHRYAGTIDLVGMWDGRRAVVDWKTSLSPTGLCADIQLAAYVEALRQPPRALTGLRVNEQGRCVEPFVRVGVSLRSDGTYRVFTYDNPRDFSIFLAALTVCHEQRRRRGVETETR
jgi:hypothetical protein